MKQATTTIEVTPEGRYAFVDLTDELRRAIKDSGVTGGLAVAFCAHTTCALLINEWEEGAMDDLRARIEAIVPEDAYYAHDDHDQRFGGFVEHERVNGHAHVKAMVLSATSHAIPVVDGEPALGTWQRLIFFEMDEPKTRTVTFQIQGA
ncbi:MAG: secondary thiamine-phosphate synthase enzyme YjbQ [Actinomycetota bacterium]